MAWTTPNTASNGSFPSAADYTALVNDVLYGVTGRPNGRVLQISHADYTTVSTTFVDVDAANLIITLTSVTGKLLFGASFEGAMTSGTGVWYADVIIDSTNRYTNHANGFGILLGNTATQYNFYTIGGLITGLSAASHTYKLQWRVSSGTGNLHGGTNDPITFWAIEV